MMSEGGPRKPADMSARDLAVQFGGQVSSLVRQEIALAKAELVTDARQAAMGGGLLSGSAVVGHTAWLVAAAAAVAGLSLVLPVWAAALIVAGVLGVIATVLALLGRARLRRATPLKMTAESVRKDIGELAASGGAAAGTRRQA